MPSFFFTAVRQASLLKKKKQAKLLPFLFFKKAKLGDTKHPEGMC
jgi:hypothetical protein